MDVVIEPYLVWSVPGPLGRAAVGQVRTLKSLLKVLSVQHRLEPELEAQEVKSCLEAIDTERARSPLQGSGPGHVGRGQVLLGPDGPRGRGWRCSPSGGW